MLGKRQPDETPRLDGCRLFARGSDRLRLFPAAERSLNRSGISPQFFVALGKITIPAVGKGGR